jgi:hypothetical protein
VIDTRLTLLGPTGDALENMIVEPLPNGSLCWVINENSLWYLAKYSLDAVSASVIATSKGAGVAGRWKRATGETGFTPAFAELFLVGGVAIIAGANWQAMPTGEVVYTVMANENITVVNDVCTLAASQPTGIFLARAVLTMIGVDTEAADEMDFSLAISKNGELIGGALSGQAQGRQATNILYTDTSGLPAVIVVAERMVELAAGNTVQGVVQAVAAVGTPDAGVSNYTFSVQRLSAE